MGFTRSNSLSIGVIVGLLCAASILADRAIGQTEAPSVPQDSPVSGGSILVDDVPDRPPISQLRNRNTVREPISDIEVESNSPPPKPDNGPVRLPPVNDLSSPRTGLPHELHGEYSVRKQRADSPVPRHTIPTPPIESSEEATTTPLKYEPIGVSPSSEAAPAIVREPVANPPIESDPSVNSDPPIVEPSGESSTLDSRDVLDELIQPSIETVPAPPSLDPANDIEPEVPTEGRSMSVDDVAPSRSGISIPQPPIPAPTQVGPDPAESAPAGGSSSTHVPAIPRELQQENPPARRRPSRSLLMENYKTGPSAIHRSEMQSGRVIDEPRGEQKSPAGISQLPPKVVWQPWWLGKVQTQPMIHGVAQRYSVTLDALIRTAIGRSPAIEVARLNDLLLEQGAENAKAADHIYKIALAYWQLNRCRAIVAINERAFNETQQLVTISASQTPEQSGIQVLASTAHRRRGASLQAARIGLQQIQNELAFLISHFSGSVELLPQDLPCQQLQCMNAEVETARGLSLRQEMRMATHRLQQAAHRRQMIARGIPECVDCPLPLGGGPQVTQASIDQNKVQLQVQRGQREVELVTAKIRRDVKNAALAIEGSFSQLQLAHGLANKAACELAAIKLSNRSPENNALARVESMRQRLEASDRLSASEVAYAEALSNYNAALVGMRYANGSLFVSQVQ